MDYRINGNVPRFQLDRRQGRSRFKMRCPQCGKERCLTPYVDAVTGQPIGPEFGRCDHERKCGYDNRPKGKDVADKELWVSNNDVKKDFKYPVNPDITNFVPMSEVLMSVNPASNNTMYDFLTIIFPPSEVRDIFRRYFVGTMNLWKWVGCSVFWQIDTSFTCRTGKIMEYYIKKDGDGNPVNVKRVKEGENEFPHVTYYHSLHGKDYQLRQCLFGEHLLNFATPEQTINIVESEKTAIICAIEKPNELFLATGGLQNFRQEVMNVLRGRKVVAHPDKGEAFNIWQEKIAKNLPYMNIKVSDYLQKVDSLEDGDDIADLIIKRKLKSRK